jgi:predicted urease superfamily metal-dependent hydrolase|tara:strand:+ start:197 stop:427 length:231 start_codon:yes stop_codon:yes gene_type:complete
MTLPELIDSLIELSTEEMPDEARQSLDDAIDHIVSSMNDGELEGLLVKGMEHIDVDENEFETLMIKSILSQSLGFA